VVRDNSQITISYTPGGGTYNQNYNLLNIDNTDSTQLFTTPKYPGDQYQMKVNLWGNDNSLVETQMVNITTVYGSYLSVPGITFVIPKDANVKGLFDLNFTLGDSDVLPAYDNSASNSITSAIELSFANTFKSDLGTGLSAGSEIACLHISGLTFNTMGRIKCRIYPSVSTITFPTILITGYDRILAGSTVRVQFANLQTLAAGITDYCKLGVSLTYFDYGGAKGYVYEPVSFVVGPTTAPTPAKTITFTVAEAGTNYVGELTDYAFSGTIQSGFAPVTTSDYFVVQFPDYTFEGRFNQNKAALCSLAALSKCNVFGLASQIYISPSATVSATAFSFTVSKLLNAAFETMYVNKTITIFTVVSGKVNALGTATFLKFTQASKNISSIITSIDSIYGGDSDINYYFSFQLNSYLPESGKISIFFPSIYSSLFTLNSKCFLRSDSQVLAGSQAYCSIINNYQLVIVPNGVLLSQTLPYYVIVTSITNPNLNLSSYSFKIETYYSSSVYNPAVISRTTFASPAISTITVKECKLQVSLSITNPLLDAEYNLNIICPSPIKEASELKVYLSWSPNTANGTCSSDTSTLYSTQCNILTEYDKTTRLTYLSIYLRKISAQKVITVTGTIKNGIAGTYNLKSSISQYGFVYMNATSNNFYITSSSSTSATDVTSSSSGTVITSTGQAISIRSKNYPLNRQYLSIYSFAITRPNFVVSTIQIDVPSIIAQSADGVTCAFQTYQADDNYFSLMIKQGSNSLTCQMDAQRLVISGLTSVMTALSGQSFLYLTVHGLLNPQTSVSSANFTFKFINTSSTYTQAVLVFSIPLSYAVSDPPADIQIGSIVLSNPKFFATSTYTFTVGTVNQASLTISKDSRIGIIIKFPVEYVDIWKNIDVPASVSIIIGGTTYTATNITMSERHLFAVLPYSAFTTQVDFSSFNVEFVFRNPNVAIDCSVVPVFTVSLFDFKGQSIYAQTLSNNQVCPTFTTRLYAINVTGNTKISAGSASNFYITLEKPAKNLTITPQCASSAISFRPTSITFENYTGVAKTFQISVANGLSGSFNVTFTKSEGDTYTFYNDIQYITLNVYIPTSKYYIRIEPFKTKSVGLPIVVNINLEVGSKTSFVLLSQTNCSSSFEFNPATRITIPADTTKVNFTVTYKGSAVPKECTQTFSISSQTTVNYYLENPTVYYSSSLSIDKTWVESPMVLELTTTPKSSADIGHSIITYSSTQTGQYQPTVYKLSSNQIGSNTANFSATTSYDGTVFYAVVPAGTPSTLISAADIYGLSLKSGVSYGNSSAVLAATGVNTLATFLVTGL
jgi:hypothetical protein